MIRVLKSLRKRYKVLIMLLAVILLTVAGYVAYVFLSYHRIPDHQPITGVPATVKDSATTGEKYTITTYNIGFGAYLPDYTFFMDGGKESRARSAKLVEYAVGGAANYIKNEAPDFAIFEEVDLDADRSWHIDQYQMLKDAMFSYTHTFAVNYDSAYLFYPVTKPIGKSKSGIAFFSNIHINPGERRSLPIENGFNKLFDLDRCYSVNRIPVDNGKELVIYALHLSAYTPSEAVRTGQMKMLLDDMEQEYQKGNYVIAGGDFNRDFKAKDDSELTFDWAHPLERELLPEGIHAAFDLLSEEEQAACPSTTRNADIPYDPEKSFTVTIDGFLLSDNIEMKRTFVLDDVGYAYSDHNPVKMTFVLKD